jgi:hypothetical protein
MLLLHGLAQGGQALGDGVQGSHAVSSAECTDILVCVWLADKRVYTGAGMRFLHASGPMGNNKIM